MHLPVVGLSREIQRLPNYVLGFARWSDVSDGGASIAIREVATRCAQKFHRRTLLIRTQQLGDEFENAEISTNRSELNAQLDLTIVRWKQSHWLGSDDTESSDAALAEIATLPKFMRRYSLIVIELGMIGSRPSLALGRLCHGVTILTSDRPRGVQVADAVRDLELQGISTVGVWAAMAVA